MSDFSVSVTCKAGEAPHEHTIVIGSGSGAYGVAAPSAVRLQYTCPLTGDALITTFKPPVGAARPFSIREVR
jgi:hypothetical protein